MSAVSVTCSRTIGLARRLYATSFEIAIFLAASAFLFAFHLESAEGGRLSLAAVWTLSASQTLPVLSVLLAMDVWSDEFRSGRIDTLLSTAVRERDLTFGKFLGVWALAMASAFAFFLISIVTLAVVAPQSFASATLASFIPGFFALALQGALWCAIGVASSACFRSASASACLALLLTVFLPRGIWTALRAWSSEGGSAFGEMAIDAQAIDMASGLFSTGVVVSYASLGALALFLASKHVAARRYVGVGARRSRVAVMFSRLLAVAVAILFATLAIRTDIVIDLPVGGGVPSLSERTLSILADTHGRISMTCFLSRDDARFRPTARLARSFAHAAKTLGGVEIDIRYVDPRWDIAQAGRLARRGVAEDSLVFECGGRIASLPADESLGERLCASTILRLASPPPRSAICWTFGHGEASFDDYGRWGMSEIARELRRDGYRNEHLDLAADSPIAADTALIVIAGARKEFSRVETDRLDAYLRQGGRLLVLAGDDALGGVSSLMPSWGVRSADVLDAGTRTLSGHDAIVSEFSDHFITGQLRGSQVVFERPLTLQPSTAVSAGVDGLSFTPLASDGAFTLAAAVERGAGAGEDLALRPTRIVVVGDSLFASNGALQHRANSNGDFFLNCVAYLSGTGAATAGGFGGDALATGMDRAARGMFIVISGAVMPLAAFLLLAFGTAFRRMRS